MPEPAKPLFEVGEIANCVYRGKQYLAKINHISTKGEMNMLRKSTKNGDSGGGSVVEADGDMFFIHYVGWKVKWDEWVPVERLAKFRKVDKQVTVVNCVKNKSSGRKNNKTSVVPNKRQTDDAMRKRNTEKIALVRNKNKEQIDQVGNTDEVKDSVPVRSKDTRRAPVQNMEEIDPVRNNTPIDQVRNTEQINVMENAEKIVPVPNVEEIDLTEDVGNTAPVPSTGTIPAVQNMGQMTPIRNHGGTQPDPKRLKLVMEFEAVSSKDGSPSSCCIPVVTSECFERVNVNGSKSTNVKRRNDVERARCVMTKDDVEMALKALQMDPYDEVSIISPSCAQPGSEAQEQTSEPERQGRQIRSLQKPAVISNVDDDNNSRSLIQELEAALTQQQKLSHFPVAQDSSNKNNDIPTSLRVVLLADKIKIKSENMLYNKGSGPSIQNLLTDYVDWVRESEPEDLGSQTKATLFCDGLSTFIDIFTFKELLYDEEVAMFMEMKSCGNLQENLGPIYILRFLSMFDKLLVRILSEPYNVEDVLILRREKCKFIGFMDARLVHYFPSTMYRPCA